jgi:hypothetical protein
MGLTHLASSDRSDAQATTLARAEIVVRLRRAQGCCAAGRFWIQRDYNVATLADRIAQGTLPPGLRPIVT